MKRAIRLLTTILFCILIMPSLNAQTQKNMIIIEFDNFIKYFNQDIEYYDLNNEDNKTVLTEELINNGGKYIRRIINGNMAEE